jgi:hypothetical protein
MKLSEVQTRQPVKDGAAGSTRQYFRDEDGWSLDFEQGMVTARKGDLHRLIPVANVAWMTPAKPKKAEAA